MSSTCPSCGSVVLRRVGKIPSSDVFAGQQLPEPLDGGYLYKCTECYLSFRFPVRSESKLEALYRKGSEDAWTCDPTKREDWRIASLWIRKLLPQGSSILDVGCFDGEFLGTLSSSYRLFGVEIQEGARYKASARGVKIIAKRHEELEGASKRFDGIVSFDVIEHVRNPVSFLAKLSNVVHPSGIVIVSSGNSEAGTWRFMGSRYWYCTIAEHISFISPRWCDAVISSVGLRVESQQRFSHASVGFSRKLGETTRNLAYYTIPGATSWLRKRGFGGKDVQHCRALADHPPSWMSARDHFIFLTRKTASAAPWQRSM